MNEHKGKPIEIDCATHNSVEDMRHLQEQCQTRPLDCKYKIFILDECHLISNSGWSSLLKILEEPPEYVIFLFATTDPQKIMGTILSRVQRFNFQKISTQGIFNRLIYILNQENITNYQEEALKYISVYAKGGMRAAITTMQKCLDYGELTLDNVMKVTSGGVTESLLLKLTQYIVLKDAKNSLLLVNDTYSKGVDMTLFQKMYIEFLTNSVMYLLTQDAALSVLSSETLKWLDSNISYLNNIREILLSLLNASSYNVNQLETKIILESWIISKCK